ncbi:MAG: efflux RND transporter periplasmic adaptor subunit [Propionibacteriaceae bacterium]|jgi:multidrug efflux pump subunit AcrA (membrane-fusion protein)|nr:efflux RND transporter periplasmic adaptor subunit [Propionibacteriaceae bacterium]
MNRKILIGCGIGAAVALAAGGGIYYSAATSGTQVGVAQAAVVSLSTTVDASGTVAAGVKTGVFPAAAGTVKELLVNDGDVVQAGDPLAKQDTAGLKLAVQQAKANLAAAQAQLEVISWTAPTSADKSAASAAVSAAKSALSTANSNYSSYKALYNAASPDEQKTMVIQLRSLKSAKSQASAALKQAQAAQKRLKITGATSKSTSAANKAIAVAETALDQAQQNLDNATLTAPMDGVVTLGAGMEAGAGLTPGVAAFTITDPSGLIFRAAIDEASIGSIIVGQEVQVTLDAAPDTPYKGTVTRIAASPTLSLTGSTSYPVDIAFDYGQARVFQGMNGSVNISTETIGDALTVPVESVISGSGGKYVYVLNADGTVKQTPVTLGAETATAVQILSGLNAGDTVITTGATTLQDGQAVQVATA